MEQGKHAPRDCTWTAIIHQHQSNHMGDGLSQFALLIVTQQEQCASAEREQNIQIVLWLRHVGFNCKHSQILNIGFF